MIFSNVSSEVVMTASAPSPPSVTVTLPSSTFTVHLPAPSMSKRYELVIPAVFAASARLSRLSKKSLTDLMAATLPQALARAAVFRAHEEAQGQARRRAAGQLRRRTASCADSSRLRGDRARL